MRLSKKDRRVLVLGGSAVALILLVTYVALPFFDSMSAVEEELTQKEKALQQRVRALANQGLYEEERNKLDQELGLLRGQLLDSPDAAMAQSQLETIVRALADDTGVVISRSTPLQDRKSGERYSKVTLQINLQCGMLELGNFLHQLATHQKFLGVEELYITSFRVKDEIKLQPRMNVSGYIRLPESAPKS